MNTVQMAAKLYDARDSARTLLGDGFDAKMQEFSRAIDDVAKAKEIGHIPAMTLICETALAEGYPTSALYAMAACVELIEKAGTGELQA